MTALATVETGLSFLVVGIVLAGVGQAIAMVLGASTHPLVRLWHRTAPLHPILAGAAIGLYELPIPGSMGASKLAGMLWYCSAGVLSSLIYKQVRKYLEKKLPE